MILLRYGVASGPTHRCHCFSGPSGDSPERQRCICLFCLVLGTLLACCVAARRPYMLAVAALRAHPGRLVCQKCICLACVARQHFASRAQQVALALRAHPGRAHVSEMYLPRLRSAAALCLVSSTSCSSFTGLCLACVVLRHFASGAQVTVEPAWARTVIW